MRLLVLRSSYLNKCLKKSEVVKLIKKELVPNFTYHLVWLWTIASGLLLLTTRLRVAFSDYSMSFVRGFRSTAK